jgi:hypothetical protein
MNTPKLLPGTLIIAVLTLCANAALAQVRVEGTVYDATQRFPMQGVSVVASSGSGTMTDSLGHYSIRLAAGDSIYFSWLGKSTSRFAVKKIEDPSQFDMSLDLPVESLPSVFVGPRSYRMDSLENRKEYAKIFDYSGTNFIEDKKASGNPTFGIGLDMDIFFNAARNKRMDRFREFLIWEEHDKYVDHRFTKALVRRITGLQPPALDTFMHQYRPGYEYLQSFATDWEFYQYIQQSGKYFLEMWKEEHPNEKLQPDTLIQSR